MAKPEKKKKLSKKEQLRLARLEAWEESRRVDRENAENDETSARRQLGVLQQLGWSELLRQQLTEYAEPERGLSMPYTMARQQEAVWEGRVLQLESRLSDTTELLQHTTMAKEALEDELREVRSYKRNDRDVLSSRMKTLERGLKKRLDEVISTTLTDVEEERQKARELWNQDVERTRVAFVELLQEIKETAGHLTHRLQEAKASHTNLPSRIRRRVEGLEKQELLLIIDTLSFEPEVLEYFMFRYPPQPEFPYGGGPAANREKSFMRRLPTISSQATNPPQMSITFDYSTARPSTAP
eukprot:Hpha_TRINITY_DN13135_c0_g1::TRINITY_DN13135_c0_g1_i1::g.113368::m.113368